MTTHHAIRIRHGLDDNDCADVLAYVNYMRPLEGCDYDGEKGRQVLLRIATAPRSIVACLKRPRSKLCEMPPLTLRDCADALYFVRNVEPADEPALYYDERGEREDCGQMVPGFCRALKLVEAMLRVTAEGGAS
jgi:hypothetical protein